MQSFQSFKSSLHAWCIIACAVLLFSGSAARAISFDPTFDGDGKQFVDIGGTGYIHGTANAVAVQSDGKVVVAGYTTPRSNSAEIQGVAVARLNADGSLDSSFSGDGTLILPLGLDAQAKAVAVQGDGKIVLAGSNNDGGKSNFIVARLNADGSLDNSFSDDGLFILPADGSAWASTVTLQSDGKIVAAGPAYQPQTAISSFAIVRLNANGTLDDTFAKGGKLLQRVGDTGAPNDIALQGDGKIVVSGTISIGASSYMAAIRITTNGALDGTFAGNGIYVLRLQPANSAVIEHTNAAGIGLQSNGNIVLGGVSTAPEQNLILVYLKPDSSLYIPPRLVNYYGIGTVRLVVQSDDKIVISSDSSQRVTRLDSIGNFDYSFGENGSAPVSLSKDFYTVRNVAVASNGKVAVVGVSDERLSVSGLNADGSLQPGFPNGPLPWTVPIGSSDSPQSLAQQSDGKIVVAGSSRDDFGTHFSIARLNANGSLDSGFSGDGKRRLDVGGNVESVTAIALQSDGKILIAGNTNAGHSASNNFQIHGALARLNPDGSLDSSFDGDGKLILLPSAGLSAIYGVALQSDGKIVVTGYSGSQGAPLQVIVARFNADGSPDATFNVGGTPGVVFLTLGQSSSWYSYASTVLVQSDGKIVLAGVTGVFNYPNSSSASIAVVRLNSDGSPDSSFNGDGKLILAPAGSGDITVSALLQSNNKIAVAAFTAPGYTGYDPNNPDPQGSILIARLNTNGSFDNTFDGDGMTSLSATSAASYARPITIALQSDQKLLVVSSGMEAGVASSVARLNPNGSLDTTLGGDGIVTLPIDGGYGAALVQSDDKLVVAGSIRNTGMPSDDFLVERLILRTPALSINNPRTFQEGSAAEPGSVTLKVILNEAATETITVNYQTADGTAKDGSDYVAKSGTLTFAPGETTLFIKVHFIGDDVAELSETFFLDLKTPAGATIADSRGSVYIRDDDGPSISIANAEAVNEGNSGTKPQKFIVTLSAPSPRQVTVDWKTANNTAGPADYAAASGTLHFNPGQTSQTITVYVKGDTVVEPNETYKVNLSNPQYAVIADSQGIAYILNDDTPSATSFVDTEPSQ